MALLADGDISSTGIANIVTRIREVRGKRQRAVDLRGVTAGGIATIVASGDAMSGADASSEGRKNEDKSSRTHDVVNKVICNERVCVLLSVIAREVSTEFGLV